MIVTRPDDYLVELFEAHTGEIVAVVVEMAADRTRPSMSPQDVLGALSRAGMPRFARRVAEALRS